MWANIKVLERRCGLFFDDLLPENNNQNLLSIEREVLKKLSIVTFLRQKF